MLSLVIVMNFVVEQTKGHALLFYYILIFYVWVKIHQNIFWVLYKPVVANEVRLMLDIINGRDVTELAPHQTSALLCVLHITSDRTTIQCKRRSATWKPSTVFALYSVEPSWSSHNFLLPEITGCSTLLQSASLKNEYRT